MVFSSSIFLFFFLPVALAFYFIAPKKLKNLILLILSLLFYSWGEGKLVILLLASSLCDYLAAIIIEKGYKRSGLLLSVLVNISLLAFFKYFNFAHENYLLLIEQLGLNSAKLSSVPRIVLPIGISFYTFQTLSYTIDVYRGNIKANRNFIDYAAYVAMFPQLIAGPIVRYSEIKEQLQNKDISFNNFILGSERFIIGLAKKVLIANTFAEIADDIFMQNPGDLTSFYAWTGIIAYSFQIYYDFSGYSDMAIGLAKMFGFHFNENFNYPYISKSIREFWRRWHISLSQWFRDYLYISLGGNRNGNFRTYINLFIVFFITGLWHGASWNFIFWGLFHGFFMILERIGLNKVLTRLWKPVQHLYALSIVVIAWVFFRVENFSDALIYLQSMFNFSCQNSSLTDVLSYHINLHSLFVLLIAVLFSMPVFSRINSYLNRDQYAFVKSLIYLILFSISIIYIVSNTYNPFIYYRF